MVPELKEKLVKPTMRTSICWHVLPGVVVFLGDGLCPGIQRYWAQIRLSVSGPSVQLVSEAAALEEEKEGFE